MENIEEVANSIKQARAQIQKSLKIVEIGGPVNNDTRQWLVGQNRAYGFVLLWLKDAGLIESIHDESKQE